MATENGEIKKVIDRMDDITLKLIHSDINAAKEFLKEEGLDPDEELIYGSKQLKKIHFSLKANNQIARDKDLLEKAFVKLKESIAVHAEKAGDVLRNILKAKNPALQYRKLENWTDEEIRDVLQDLDLIQLMDELEKDC